VEGAEAAEDTEEEKDVNDDIKESGSNANAVVDTEPEFDLPLELLYSPPGEATGSSRRYRPVGTGWKGPTQQ